MRKQILAVFFILIVFVTLSLFRRTFTHFLFPMVQFLVRGGESVRNRIEFGIGYFLSKQQLVVQLAQLERDKSELWRRMASAEYAVGEWKSLAARIHWVDELPTPVATTRVYTTDPRPPRTLIVAVGEEAGVRRGQRVVTSSGAFFGVIRDVQGRMATITPVTERDFSVKVTRAGSVRVMGVTAGGIDTEVRIQFIPKIISVEAGELLFAYFELSNPSHIPLGTVKSVEGGPDALFQNATVELLTPLPRVTTVSILAN